MVLNIEQDHLRFRQIVRGKIKADLKKYISQGELIGKKGKDFVSIPIPQIEMPNFRFGRRNTGGVGQGEGEPGTPLAPGDVEEDGAGQAGNEPGGHILEVDLTLEELAQILAEELELPRIQPKGNNRLKTERDRYSQISNVGPESPSPFQTHLQGSAQTADLRGQLRSGKSLHRSDPRRQALPFLENEAEAGKQRSHHLYDGCVRFDGRRTKGNRSSGIVLDRHLDPDPTTKAW